MVEFRVWDIPCFGHEAERRESSCLAMPFLSDPTNTEGRCRECGCGGGLGLACVKEGGRHGEARQGERSA